MLGDKGVVSSAHPLATEAGLEVLKSGGNAFSAAVAIATTLNVVEPMMSGIGGYGTILLYDAKEGKAWFLNPSGRIPRGVDSDQFRAPTPNFLENRRGAKAVSTPGNVHAWEAMSNKYGNVKWSRLFDAAIRHAEEGYAISNRTAQIIKVSFPELPVHAQEFYGRAGAPIAVGEKLVQKDLANTLRRIAYGGAKAFYEGGVAGAIDAEMKLRGGFLSAEDLRNDQAEWWDPIQIEFNGYQIVTASPPANAFDALVRIGMMGEYDLSALEHNSAEYLHRFAEVTKHGFWVRLAYAGDPDIAPPPLQKLLSKQYWDEQTKKIDLSAASTFQPPLPSTQQGDHTTHFVVADRWGNVVSATQTLGNLFGSKIMPPGTGIWLNNSLEYCTFEPKGNPMDAHPGRRKLSGDCPTLIMKDSKPWAAIGTPGGHSIGQTIAQMVLNLVVFQMDIQQAITAPKISFIEPDVLAVEQDIPELTRTKLQAMGHRVRLVRALGNAHGLVIEYDERGTPARFFGGADPRGEGVARGYWVGESIDK
ncbi:MAG TPA: gamma-glutamyltransferase [Bacteroidota bacterium]